MQETLFLEHPSYYLTYMGNNTGVVRSKQDPLNTSIEILSQPLIEVGRASVTDGNMKTFFLN